MAISKKVNFNELLDTIFLINQEVIKDCGEDSYYCAHCKSSAIISVFDGCGGLGSRTYQSFQRHTGAYMASRTVSGAVHDWYHDHRSTKWKNPDQLIECLDRYIKKAYDICSSKGAESLKIRGSMVRDYPTTAAIALAEEDGSNINLHVMWAGDSRVYLIDSQGLAQLTEDDTDSEDAMDNLTSDGVLTNLLSSDGRYEIHYRNIKLNHPAIVFAATDGCFGYIPTPMEFEFLLLKALVESETPTGFKHRINSCFQDYAGDDFTLGFMSFSYGSFENMRKSFTGRVEELERKYICNLAEDRNEQAVMKLWKKYRPVYERFLNDRRG